MGGGANWPRSRHLDSLNRIGGQDLSGGDKQRSQAATPLEEQRRKGDSGRKWNRECWLNGERGGDWRGEF